MNGTIFGGICEPCRCFGHAEYCDDVTGECLVSACFSVDATDKADVSSAGPAIPSLPLGP